MRCLLCCCFATMLGLGPAVAQRRPPWTAPPPLLTLGQRVRVSTWEQGSLAFGTSPFGSQREVRLAGTLVAYRPLDSVRIARTGVAALFSPHPERTLYWSSVAQIDVPNGRNTLDGAARGLGGAFGVALMFNLVGRAFGCSYSHNCPNVWRTTGQVALVTVPAGTVYGFFSTRWKRVY